MRLFKTRPPAGVESWAEEVAQLVDEWAAYHGDWRADANAVTNAYQQWLAAPAQEEEQEQLFAAYVAALDQEEAAANSYELLINKLDQLLPESPAPTGSAGAS